MPADDSSLVGLRLRIENGSDQPGTLRGLNFEMPCYAPETTLDSNAGPLRVRDVGDAESRADVAAGTFRIYDLVFFSSSPSSSLRTFILVTPRLRGYRWVPIGTVDYRLASRSRELPCGPRQAEALSSSTQVASPSATLGARHARCSVGRGRALAAFYTRDARPARFVQHEVAPKAGALIFMSPLVAPWP